MSLHFQTVFSRGALLPAVPEDLAIPLPSVPPPLALTLGAFLCGNQDFGSWGV